MVEKPKKLLHIDLNQFKLHIALPHTPALTLHFDSPSRRFYLSVIALVVHEMKRLGRITSIPLEEHLELLGLLNETVGGSAGSSQREHLLPRIYRKWKDALPDLEDAPLFKVLGRKKDFEEGIGAAYQFTDEEKDIWANLFEYRGSEEHVRLRFSIDKVDAGLDDVVITYEEDPELIDDAAWDRFIADLRQEVEKQQEHAYKFSKEKKSDIFLLRKWKRVLPRRWKWPALAAVIAIVTAFVVWQYSWYAPHKEGTPSEKMAFPLPDKPSIAVLPFENMSGNPELEYLSDGITEHIITCISKVPKLFVIARHSTFTYKGKPTRVQQVSRELGVRYVMEGSIHRSGDRIRITAQLIDAIEGHHLWAERYDRKLKDVFALQDEITMEILRAIEVKLTEGEQARIYRRGTDNIEAYVKALKAIEYHERFNKDDMIVARQLCEEAIALDPEYARPYRVLAMTHLMEPFYGTGTSPKKSMERALELAHKAISLDDSHPCSYEVLSYIYAMTRQYGRAIAEAERAIALDPNGADGHVALGYALQIAGRPEEAIASLEKAIRSNPIAPGHYFRHLGCAYRMVGRYEEAIAAYKKALDRSPDSIMTHVHLTATYSFADRDDEARAQAKEVLRIQPKFSVNRYAKKLPFKDQAETRRLIEALNKAGLPDKPALPLPDKPSIAVLPFVNMSGDPEQKYFSDGITEEIITALSKVEKLFVIASSSVFAYKGKPVKVQQIAEDLGVQYVLEGSVRRSGDRIRITAQFVDARKGNHLWGERYDRELKDLFALQDEITMKIIATLEVTLTEGEQALIAGSGTDNLDAYLKILQARDLKRHQNIEDNHKARSLAEEAIALDPDYAQAYRWLSGTHLVDVWLGSTKSPRESLRKAVELAQKALSLDDNLGGAHGLLGNIYIMKKDYKKGIREAQRAVELEPNGADAHAFLGMGLRFADRAGEAIPILRKAIRLNPHAPGWYMHNLAGTYRNVEKFEEATHWAERAVQENPRNVLSRIVLCSIYSVSGRMDKAREQAQEIMSLNPNLSVDRLARTSPQKNQVLKQRFIDALRKAGLK